MWIANLVDLFSFEDEMVPIKLELNRQRKLLGIGEVVFATADWRRIESEYIGFFKQVLEDLNAEGAGTQALPFDHLSVTIKRAASQPKTVGTEPRHKMRRAKVPSDIESSTVLKRGWDGRLRASYLVYSTVRRHLWRHVVHEHQGCIAATGNHFWWHMEGERTTSFCPIAEAFLRWRMYWEACGTPGYLFARMRKDPFGLAGWMAASAPICPPGWAWEAEQWISDHVLGQACLASFRELLDIAIRDRGRDRIEWNGHVFSGKYATYWTVAGRDTPTCPVRIYEQLRIPYQLKATIDQHHSDREHRRDHRMSLVVIQR